MPVVKMAARARVCPSMTRVNYAHFRSAPISAAFVQLMEFAYLDVFAHPAFGLAGRPFGGQLLGLPRNRAFLDDDL